MVQKKLPVRMCVACRSAKPKKELVRVVRGADGTVKLDPSGKANGRGAYLCRSEDCFKRAIKTKALERALSAPVNEDTLKQLLEELHHDG